MFPVGRVPNSSGRLERTQLSNHKASNICTQAIQCTKNSYTTFKCSTEEPRSFPQLCQLCQYTPQFIRVNPGSYFKEGISLLISGSQCFPSFWAWFNIKFCVSKSLTRTKEGYPSADARQHMVSSFWTLIPLQRLCLQDVTAHVLQVKLQYCNADVAHKNQ